MLPQTTKDIINLFNCHLYPSIPLGMREAVGKFSHWLRYAPENRKTEIKNYLQSINGITFDELSRRAQYWEGVLDRKRDIEQNGLKVGGFKLQMHNGTIIITRYGIPRYYPHPTGEEVLWELCMIEYDKSYSELKRLMTKLISLHQSTRALK